MKDAANLIAILFQSRDIAHKEHLRTKSYAAHMALGSFYTDIIDLADSFAETYMGLGGTLEIPTLSPCKGNIDSALESCMFAVSDHRGMFSKPEEATLQNIIDEIVGLYAQTLYKLRRLS